VDLLSAPFSEMFALEDTCGRGRDEASSPPARRYRSLTASLRPMSDGGETKHSIRMVADRLLVVESKEAGERKSRAGILIPATADVSRRLVWAEVAAVGPTVRTVEAGDTVLFSPDTGFEVEIQGEEYLILRERDVHAVASIRSEGGTGLYL
jgi:chaperonin GroES